MPPLDALPLVTEVGRPPLLVERIFPATTRGIYRMERGEKRPPAHVVERMARTGR